MLAIETRELTKAYEDVRVVDHLSLGVQSGELMALLGVNGAGKTTLIKMLTCLLRPSSGDALLEGRSILNDPIPIKQRINLSPQETAIAPSLSVGENLAFIAGIYGQPRRTAKLRGEEIASHFGLTPLLKKRAGTLSGGQQRRLSLAMALISEPHILFLDEPTQGLDVLARQELWSAVLALKGQVTIVLTTHYMEEVELLADRVGVMSGGKLLALGTVGELKLQSSAATLEAAFLSIAGGKK
ncbi:ATP-binding cassette domain-containing protein [Oscillospiraceae bacterium HV4-5-C5C]|nr:ATP-binding cassette domain-containing protein [Oscillospiraceae bacterium HV4-5-C5C]